MKKPDAEEIIHCLPQDKTLFYYFKDRYAPLLLSKVFRGNTTVADIKKSRFSPLLSKPVVKQVLANMGGSVLSADDLLYSWDPSGKQFLLTLGTWGADKCDYYYQTSRRGHNLVLRLNFSNQHDSPFQKLINRNYWFNNTGHPVLVKGERPYFRQTLAWARIDLDFARGEALIEEVQSDWVKWARYDYLHAKRKVSCHTKTNCRCSQMDWYKAVVQYYESVLQPYNDLWAEAMLAATVNFIVDELGLRRIYYHTHETGKAVKRCNPPRSLYAELPRKFCFKKTSEVPVFLMEDRFFLKKYKKVKSPSWYSLAI
ncbi:MAG: hypothetical protein AMJ53_16015 [Gammaproteobacteria bacterium SG8_11]|nr:MAG: hypothetical protein AMJ53_16015 [Gammaproteobacteria bacterium SG8_11]